jgi:hypothetical protein
MIWYDFKNKKKLIEHIFQLIASKLLKVTITKFILLSFV